MYLICYWPRIGWGDDCSTCKKTGKLFLCEICEKESYCSKECQKEDWSRHKEWCDKFVKQSKPLVSTTNYEIFKKEGPCPR